MATLKPGPAPTQYSAVRFAIRFAYQIDSYYKLYFTENGSKSIALIRYFQIRNYTRCRTYVLLGDWVHCVFVKALHHNRIAAFSDNE